jgi:hypothetical protein
MPRYLLVKGKPHVLVEAPSTPLRFGVGEEPRYLGKAPIPRDKRGAGSPPLDWFVDVEQTHVDDRHIRAAIRDGELELIAECEAPNHGAVARAFAAQRDRAEQQAAQRSRGATTDDASKATE